MTIRGFGLWGLLLATSGAACSGGSETGRGAVAGAPGTAKGGGPGKQSGGTGGGGGNSTGVPTTGSGGTGGSGGTTPAGGASGGATGTGSGGAGGTTASGGAAGSTVACAPLAPIPRRILPLDAVQYGSAARDLLALLSAPTFPGTVPASVNPHSDLVIDSDYLYALYVTAGAIATDVAPRAAALAACSTGETDVGCATRFVRAFGRQTFRRALDEDEVTDLLSVFTGVCPGPSQSCASPADFATAIDLVIKTVMLAPSFLYRTELGPRSLTADATGTFPDTTLTADEVATQLAFSLLGSTPDAGLMAAADSGALTTQAGLRAEISRLVALPQTQANVTGMVGRWLDVDRVADHVKDITLLSPLMAPDQDQSAIAAALRTSWDQAVNVTLWSSPAGKVTDLLTSQTFYADWRLATLYGLPHGPASDATLKALAWPTVQPRAGILTHPAFLWSLSDPVSVSPVKRGLAIHRDVVCEDPVLPDPPLSAAEALAVIQTGDSEATHSDARLAATKLCADSCHGELDPYGRLLHAFDAAGNFRTVDEVGRAIDTSAVLTARSPLGPMTVAGPVAFAQALVSSKVFSGCAVQRLFEAALDTTVPNRDACQVAELRTRFDQSDGTMAALLHQVAESDFARARAGGAQ